VVAFDVWPMWWLSIVHDGACVMIVDDDDNDSEFRHSRLLFQSSKRKIQVVERRKDSASGRVILRYCFWRSVKRVLHIVTSWQMTVTANLRHKNRAPIV
jgi:hypothetical protein